MTQGTVYIVHAVDTEGPLYESIESKFERLGELFDLSGVKANIGNLEKLSKGEIDLGSATKDLQEVLKTHKNSTLGTWTELNEMLEEVTSEEYRLSHPDSFGDGWVFNWFCMDHVGYQSNPRKRDMGYHNIHDRYVALVEDQDWSNDTISFHFHPVSTYREAHRCGTHYFRTDDFYQTLCRRLIDRNFFPSSYRAGFQAERPDIHWFLEQFIPYDISNMACENTSDIDACIDFKNGRSGNWRNAPNDWSVYHPDHDDYQKPGNCRRLIGRALNINTRIGNITQEEMDKAFDRASQGKDTLLGLCSHDWRDLTLEVSKIFEMLECCKKKFPEINYKFSQTNEAFKTQLLDAQKKQSKLKLKIVFHEEERGVDVDFIEIKTLEGKVFGPQPYLAIKTKSQRYIHDNLDFGSSGDIWYYAFHHDTLPLSDVSEVVVAANDINGNTEIVRLKFE
ncbi:MAG: hypothetical protein KC646_06010 [Candidatus Cloacimonetes bacterium]|nr:hypothetical protein [Candidatus Cloacimonadota bacterium]